ncbi:MAG: flagellin [Gammaproteobacteria bacterium]
MALTINTNLMSLYAQNNLSKSQSSLSDALQQLSSGLRVQNAASDASGYYSSQLMTGDINGMGQAVRNANDGVSLAQTAGGAMQQISDSLQRINQLAVEAANGTVSSAARGGIQKEVDQLTQQISQIVTTTKYAGTQLLSGSTNITFQVGQNGSANDQITATGVNLANGTNKLNSFSSTLTATNTIKVSSQSAASAAITSIQADIKTVASESATFGAIQNRFNSVVANLTNSQQNLTAARSTIVDTNYAAQTAALSRAQILQQAGVSMLAQANSIPQLALKLLG